jgi:predicted amidohydrolase
VEHIIKNLYSISFTTTKDYKQNLQTLTQLIQLCDEDSIVLAPEVCLSGFDYENIEAACDFAGTATQELKKISKNKTIVLTMIERCADSIVNVAKIFKDGELIRTQAKSKLFKLGDEHKFFSSGDEKDIEIFEVDGVKLGILICFELRFKELWQKLEGADIILVPAMWGAIRAENFKVLTQALAVINQCYVIASDSKNKECSGEISVVTPFGDAHRNGNTACLSIPYDPKEIKKMRKYLDVGIG